MQQPQPKDRDSADLEVRCNFPSFQAAVHTRHRSVHVIYHREIATAAPVDHCRELIKVGLGDLEWCMYDVQRPEKEQRSRVLRPDGLDHLLLEELIFVSRFRYTYAPNKLSIRIYQTILWRLTDIAQRQRSFRRLRSTYVQPDISSPG